MTEPAIGAEPAISWQFARSPKWILSHVLVLSLIVGMVIAGLWQVARHQDRSERNDLIRARAELEALDIGEVAPPGTPSSIGEDEQFRRVTATGEYRSEDEVLVRNRTFGGSPGWWVLTPFVTDDGWAVTVNRGWIPIAFDAGEARPGTEAPSGRITIQGFIEPAREAEGFQRADPVDGQLLTLARPDVERLAQQLDYDLSPVVFQLAPVDFAERAEGNELPFTLELPPLDAGPHASYAAQWFIFTTIAVIGYPLVLRRVARGRAESSPYDEDDDDRR